MSKSLDALHTLREDGPLKAFVMTTLNKLPHIKPDLVRIDDKWEDWSLKDLLDNLQKWLLSNKTTNDSKHIAKNHREENAIGLLEKGVEENRRALNVSFAKVGITRTVVKILRI